MLGHVGVDVGISVHPSSNSTEVPQSDNYGTAVNTMTASEITMCIHLHNKPVPTSRVRKLSLLFLASLSLVACSQGPNELNHHVDEAAGLPSLVVPEDGTPSAYWVSPGERFAVVRYQWPSEACPFDIGSAALLPSGIAEIEFVRMDPATVCASMFAPRTDVFTLPREQSSTDLSVIIHYPGELGSFEIPVQTVE